MSEEGRRRLWQQIGIDNSGEDTHQLSGSGGAESQVMEVAVVGDSFEGSQGMGDENRAKVGVVEQEKAANRAEHFQRMMEDLNLSVQQIEESEQVIMAESLGAGVAGSSERGEELDSFYNYDISRIPESVTPLVYSKNSKPADQVRFRKEHVRLGLLRLSVGEAKEFLTSVKAGLLEVFAQLRTSQQDLRAQLVSKSCQLQRQYSLRLQQSMFNHRQEYQQLRYQYQVLKAKQEATRAPVHSQFMIPEMEVSAVGRVQFGNESKGFSEEQNIELRNKTAAESRTIAQLLRENGTLKEKVSGLEAEGERLRRQGSQFKHKMGEIEASTLEVRQSNDKLYEYIFDLEQKLAYYKEEMPRMAGGLQEHYGRQLGQVQEERGKLAQRCAQLDLQIKKLTQETKPLRQKLELALGESVQMKGLAEQSGRQLAQTKRLCESKEQELQSLTRKNDMESAQFTKMLNEKERTITELKQQLNSTEPIREGRGSRASEYVSYGRNGERNAQARRVSVERNSVDRPSIEQSQEREGLLRENGQLRAVVEQLRTALGKSQSECQLLGRRSGGFPGQSGESVSQKLLGEQGWYLKERELLKYQGFLQSEALKLQSEAQKLELMQREREAELAVREAEISARRNPEVVYREKPGYRPRAYETSPDEYGMKQMSSRGARLLSGEGVVAKRTNIYNSNNNICSSEAQAIIEQVKLRNRRQDYKMHCRCPDLRNCRCQVVSRGSRTSHQSNSRSYRRGMHYRPNSPKSPRIRVNDYQPYEQIGASKMKVIEEKVRRLKSQLKNSLSTLHS